MVSRPHRRTSGEIMVRELKHVLSGTETAIRVSNSEIADIMASGLLKFAGGRIAPPPYVSSLYSNRALTSLNLMKGLHSHDTLQATAKRFCLADKYAVPPGPTRSRTGLATSFQFVPGTSGHGSR